MAGPLGPVEAERPSHCLLFLLEDAPCCRILYRAGEMRYMKKL